MARIVSLGSALQDIYLIDHDDLKPTDIGDSAIWQGAGRVESRYR